MRRQTRLVAAMQLALILPAALFITAALVGAGDVQHNPARIAQEIVIWYSERMWTLWLLLLALPFAALLAGSAKLLRSWNHKVQLPPAARQSLASVFPAPPSQRSS